jgi:hypothetical protein
MLDKRLLPSAESEIAYLPNIAWGAATHAVEYVFADAGVWGGDDAPAGAIPMLG